MPSQGGLPVEQFGEAAGEFFGQGVVDQADLARLVDQDVFGLDVAMDPALVVEVGQCVLLPG